LKIILLVILFTKSILAIEPIFTAEVDKSSIYSAESVDITLDLIANKDANITFTHMEDINGVEIIKRKSLISHDTVANGDKTEDIVEKKIIYTIKPKKNLKIEPFKVKVNNKIYKSNSLKISIIKDEKKPIVTKKAKAKKIIFKLITNKLNIYEGEPFIVTVILKEPVELASPDIKISEPKFKDCKVVKLHTLPPNNHESEYITIIENYLVTPKKSGLLNISPITAEINMQITPQVESMFGFFGAQSQVKRVKSNALKISILPKPKNVDIIGDYTIKYNINKTKTSANKQIVYSYEISGYGDLSTFKTQDIKINGVTIYPKDAKIKTVIKDQKVVSVYKKEYVLISDQDFTIPSIQINAFSPIKKKLYNLSVKPIHITIISKKAINTILNNKDLSTNSINTSNLAKKNIHNTQKNKENSTEIVLDTKYYQKRIQELSNPLNSILTFILGVLTGVILTIYLPKLLQLIKVKDEKSQLYGSYHEALNILYPHITKSEDIEEMVKELYEVTNGNKEIKIDNKKLDKMVKDVL